MVWFKVDDSFHSHPKVMATDTAALGLWVVAGSWCGANLTDGFVPDHVLPRLLPGAVKLASKLVAAGLWSRAEGGYQFHESDEIRRLWSIEHLDGRKIPLELRAFVFERDGRCCLECGVTEDLTLDHIYPWSLGGQHTADNLRVLCRSCNSKKGART